jgi:hypothetical protein
MRWESCRANVLRGLQHGHLSTALRITLLDSHAPRDYHLKVDIFEHLIHLILYFLFATVLVQIVLVGIRFGEATLYTGERIPFNFSRTQPNVLLNMLFIFFTYASPSLRTIEAICPRSGLDSDHVRDLRFSTPCWDLSHSQNALFVEHRTLHVIPRHLNE